MKIEKRDGFKPYKICIETPGDHADWLRYLEYTMQRLAQMNQMNTVGYTEVYKLCEQLKGTQQS